MPQNNKFDFIEFNTGTHKSGLDKVNPGMGQPFAVQKNETMMTNQGQSYIFQDDYKIKPKDVEKYGLPKKAIGMTIAEASKMYTPNVNPTLGDNKAKTEMLSRLQGLNEAIKLRDALTQAASAKTPMDAELIRENTGPVQEFPLGGLLPILAAGYGAFQGGRQAIGALDENATFGDKVGAGLLGGLTGIGGNLLGGALGFEKGGVVEYQDGGTWVPTYGRQRSPNTYNIFPSPQLNNITTPSPQWGVNNTAETSSYSGAYASTTPATPATTFGGFGDYNPRPDSLNMSLLGQPTQPQPLSTGVLGGLDRPNADLLRQSAMQRETERRQQNIQGAIGTGMQVGRFLPAAYNLISGLQRPSLADRQYADLDTDPEVYNLDEAIRRSEAEERGRSLAAREASQGSGASYFANRLASSLQGERERAKISETEQNLNVQARERAREIANQEELYNLQLKNYYDDLDERARGAKQMQLGYGATQIGDMFSTLIQEGNQKDVQEQWVQMLGKVTPDVMNSLLRTDPNTFFNIAKDKNSVNALLANLPK